MEIEGFNGSLPFTTNIFSYGFPELGVGQYPGEDKETGKVKLTSFLVRRASDKYSIQFLNNASIGKWFPKISLMDSVSVRGGTFKRTIFTFTEVGIENFVPWDVKGEKTENITFYFKDYQPNL